MKRNRFYLACFRDNVGSNVSFQCHGLAGYNTNVDLAHVCTLEEAQYHYDHAREYDLPLSADHVDELTVWKVDHQYIPNKTTLDGSDQYVVYRKGKFDGNDVYWILSKALSTSTDFSLALILTAAEVKKLNPEYIALPYSLADQKKRRTFDFSKVDERVMVQAAGLKMPEHIKKLKRKKDSSGKTRFNCPSCGRISWQYNPYDFDGCGNVKCSEWVHYSDRSRGYE